MNQRKPIKKKPVKEQTILSAYKHEQFQQAKSAAKSQNQLKKLQIQQKKLENAQEINTIMQKINTNITEQKLDSNKISLA